MTGNLIVKDSCVNCRNLSSLIEIGHCACDYKKFEITDRGLNLFLRRNNRLTEVKKPSYRMADVEIPLKRVIETANRLADESLALTTLTKGISEKAKKRNRTKKIEKAKKKVSLAELGIELSQAEISWLKRRQLKKAENTVVLGVLDGSIKNGEIMNWIEKRAGGL